MIHIYLFDKVLILPIPFTGVALKLLIKLLVISFMMVGIQAYLANKASPKVYEVSRKFPSQLHLEQVQRCSAWPKRFKVAPPTDGDIAVYIFAIEVL